MAIALGVMWMVIVGPPPLPERIDLVLVLLGQGVALALGIWVLMRAANDVGVADYDSECRPG